MITLQDKDLKHLQKAEFRNIKIPLPPIDIQQKIVSEIEVLEQQELDFQDKINTYKETIKTSLESLLAKATKNCTIK